MWVSGDLLLINDLYTGVHFYNITNIDNPSRIGFLTISNNVDIAVYGTTLFADSYGDLLIYDISDPVNPTLVNRLRNAVGFSYDAFGMGWMGDDMMYDGIGWGCSCFPVMYDMADSGGVNTGGSLSRFSIVGDILYTLKDNQYVQAFDLTVATNPVLNSSAAIPVWNAETLFPYEDKLFVGASTGMVIYSISDPLNPQYINQFTHAMAYDPVIVQSNVAYITLRNAADWPYNRLEVVDLNDYTNMQHLYSSALSYPYGLGANGNELYVCDGWQGLAHYDISDFNQGIFNGGLVWKGYISTTEAYDIIPLGSHVIVSGDLVRIYQVQGDGSLVLSRTLY